MTDSNETPRCIQCEKTSNEAPLVRLQYKGKDLWICTQHLPLVIHSPEDLAGKLPGIEKIGSHPN